MNHHRALNKPVAGMLEKYKRTAFCGGIPNFTNSYPFVIDRRDLALQQSGFTLAHGSTGSSGRSAHSDG